MASQKEGKQCLADEAAAKLLEDDALAAVPLYACGSNNDARLGCVGVGEFATEPMPVALPGGFSLGQFAGGGRHSLVVDAVRGSLLGVGDNSDGQLGRPTSKLRRTDGFVAVGKGVIDFVLDVAAGRTSSYALDGRRKVYAWGDGRNGRLGHGDAESEAVPRLVEGLSTWRVQQIAAGDAHCLALTVTGDVYAWGHGKYGQLGLGNSGDVLSPACVDVLAGCRVVHVSAGRQHSGAVGDTLHGRHLGASMDRAEPERVCFTWGCGGDGRLGHDELDNCFEPRVVERLRPGKAVMVSKLAMGEKHTLALCAKGVYAWGSNMYGQLGLGDLHDRRYPTLVANSGTVERMSCGSRHSAWQVSQGIVYTFGHNWYGELGQCGTKVKLAPEPIVPLASRTCIGVSCGDRHTMIGVTPTVTEDLLLFSAERCAAQMSLSEGAKSVKRIAEYDGYSYMVLAGPPCTKGKYRWNIILERLMSDDDPTAVGVVADDGSMDPTMIFDPLDQGMSYLYLSTGEKERMFDADRNEYGERFYQGDVIGVELDLDLSTLRFYKNEIDLGVAFYISSQSPLHLCVSLPGETDQATLEPPLKDNEEGLVLDEGLSICYNSVGREKTTGIEVFYECRPCRRKICRACARTCHAGHDCVLWINHRPTAQYCDCGKECSTKTEGKKK